MREPFALTRTRQCAKCPWKVSTDPFDIPHGYSPELHAKLAATIAEPGVPHTGSVLNFMGCHEHPGDAQVMCVGWLHNQIGRGNNIGLRMAMRGCSNLGAIALDGEQHQSFEDTKPPEAQSANQPQPAEESDKSPSRPRFPVA